MKTAEEWAGSMWESAGFRTSAGVVEGLVQSIRQEFIDELRERHPKYVRPALEPQCLEIQRENQLRHDLSAQLHATLDELEKHE